MEDQIAANADENNNNISIIEIKERDSLSKSSPTVGESEHILKFSGSDKINDSIEIPSPILDEISKMNQQMHQNSKKESYEVGADDSSAIESTSLSAVDEKILKVSDNDVAGVKMSILDGISKVNQMQEHIKKDELDRSIREAEGNSNQESDEASAGTATGSTIEIESSQSVTDLKAKFEQEIDELSKKDLSNVKKPKVSRRKVSALSYNPVIKMEGDVTPPQVSQLPVQVPMYEENSSPLMKLRGNKTTNTTDSTSATTNPSNNPPTRGRQQQRTSTITSGTISSSQKRRAAAFPNRNSQSPAAVSGSQRVKNVTKSSVSRPTSGSPTHLHKLRIYDGPPVSTSQNRTRPRSPYVADVFNWPDKNPPSESNYEDVIVTDRQYKLLTNVGTNEKYTKGREMPEYQNNLYNLVVLPSPRQNQNQNPRRKSSVSKSRERTIPIDSGSTDIHNKSVQKKSVSFEDTDLNDTQNVTNDEKELNQNDDQNDGLVSDKNDEKSSQENKSLVPNCIEDSNDNEQCNSGGGAAGGDGDSIGGSSINGEDSGPPREITSLEMLKDFLSNDEELQTKAMDMMKEMMNVTEVSFLLMNTFFRDIMQSPQAAVEVKKMTSFDEFIKSANELEALQRAGGIFKDASDRIRDYLKEVYRIKLSMPPITFFNDGENQNDDSKNQVFETLNEVSSTESLIVSRSFTFASGSSTNIWKFVPKLESEKIEINLLNQDGKLVESIFCNKKKLQVEFMTDSKSKNIKALALIGSTRMSSEKVPIKPQRIFDMICKSSSFISMRFVSTKHKMGKAQSLLKKHKKSIKLFEIPEDQESNWLHKKISKSRIRKLKAINIYSGIMNQMMIGINKAYLLIIDSLEKITPAYCVFLSTQLPGLNCVTSRENDGKGEIPLHKICQDLLLACEEIDCASEIGEKSFKSIIKGGSGIKIKSSYLKSISYILDALKDLRKARDVDLGALLIALACNMTIIQSSNQTLSNPVGISMIDLELRSRTYSNLSQLNNLSEATREITDDVLTMSSLMAQRSLKNLSLIKRIMTERKKQPLRFKLHMFGSPNRDKNGKKKKYTFPFCPIG